MDHNAIVEEILRRVAQKISEAEGSCAECADCGGKPGLLILTQDHGTDCHATLENEALKARYHTDCALMHHYEVDLDAYEAVVLFNLSCDAMAALASGACDTAYTRLASKAILSGKKVYVPTDPYEKKLQRSLLQYYKPENKRYVIEALIRAGRRDLIGHGPKCLVQPDREYLQKYGPAAKERPAVGYGRPGKEKRRGGQERLRTGGRQSKGGRGR